MFRLILFCMGGFADTPARPEHIYNLVEAGVLTGRDAPRALGACGLVPDSAGWRRFFDRLFLIFGVTLTLAGIIFFFAWNWHDMGRLVKLGLVQAAVAAAVLLSWRKGLDSLTGKVSLTAASVLVGALLAVYGQVYQTGADAFELFLAWMILITGWALAARFAPLWLLVVTLGNVSLVLYWHQILEVVHRRGYLDLFLVLAVCDLAVYTGWEELSQRGFSWLTTRRYGVAAAVLAAGSATIYAVGHIFDNGRKGGLLYLPLILALIAYAYGRSRDLVVLSLCMFSLIVTVISLVVKIVGGSNEALFFFYGLLVVGMTAASAALLRRISRGWGEAS